MPDQGSNYRDKKTEGTSDNWRTMSTESYESEKKRYDAKMAARAAAKKESDKATPISNFINKLRGK